MKPTRKTAVVADMLLPADEFSSENESWLVLFMWLDTSDTLPLVHWFSYLSFFLRWILPLKENNLTEEAALLIVPAKALPAFIGKDVCSG
jgi:hypothetical protein